MECQVLQHPVHCQPGGWTNFSPRQYEPVFMVTFAKVKETCLCSLHYYINFLLMYVHFIFMLSYLDT